MRHAARLWPIFALLLLTLPAGRAALAASQSACVDGGRQNPDIAALTADLQRSPNQLGKRLELAKLLEKAGCSSDAVHVLEEGKKYNPYNPTLLFNLRRARDRLEEEHYAEGLRQAESNARSSARTERCANEHDVASCDEILREQPNNTKILIAKGDALVKAHRLTDAAKAYERARELVPNNAAVAEKLQALQSQRQALLKRCTEGDGDPALQACKSVLTKGATNEFDLTVRIALLQQRGNQASQALDSYIAADSLRHGDKGVALAILALLQSTPRKDAVSLAARGSSLVTVGRAHEGLLALRQAKALEPELPDIDQQIRAAEAAARTAANVRKERANQVAVVDAKAETEAVAETTPEPPRFSNVAEVTRSN